MKQFPLKEFLSVILYPFLFLIVCLTIVGADDYFDLWLYRLGVSPRTGSGLKGIVFAPFIHGNLSHISNNSIPVFVLSSLIFYFYKPIALSLIHI